jgi:imidazolonepropionase-like amidohydrolase
MPKHLLARLHSMMSILLVQSLWVATPALAAPQSRDVLLRGGRVLVGDGTELAKGDVLLHAGKVSAIGARLEAPEGATVVDLTGRVVTPGLIDTHSHLGVYPTPDLDALEDGNESTSPLTPQLRTEHAIWPQDPGFVRALQGGVTSLQVLPGSANLIGGGSVVIKTRPALTVEEMKFPQAPMGLKMAWGENPRRVYGSRGQMPKTRMAEMAMDRAEFIRAQTYKRRWEAYEKSKTGDPPDRDIGMEALRGVLDGKVLVHCHCYRADEMAQVLGLAHEMGFKIRSFEHGLEAYKLRDRLAADGVGVSTWADWWGSKIEMYDGIPANIALLTEAGVHVALHSDNENGIQRLNQEAAKAMLAGRRLGIDIPEREAIRWLTSEPAWVLGIEAQVGRLQPGFMGDVVVWDRTPFSVYARATRVYIDGQLIYDREDPTVQPRSDFELGHPTARPFDRSLPVTVPRFQP